MAEAVRISDAEQLSVHPWKRKDDQQSTIKQFIGTDVYKSGLIAHLTHFTLISLIFIYILTHTNLVWLRSLVFAIAKAI